MRLLRALTGHWRLKHLSASMAIAMAVGLLLPALVGLGLLTQLREAQILEEQSASLAEKAALLSTSLAEPVWNLDQQEIGKIVEASLLDPRTVLVSVYDAAHNTLLSIERPERRQGTERTVVRELQQTGAVSGALELVGYVEVKVDDGLMRQAFEKDRRDYMVILLGQVALSLLLILSALHLRVLQPLRRLAQFSNLMARGEFEQPMPWSRSDEIGLLAQRMDRMRHALKGSFSEQRAILDNVQVGVIFVRDQAIQMANRHAETIFGPHPAGLAGQQVQVLFQSEDQCKAVSERIQASIAVANQPNPHEEVLYLRRMGQGVFWAHLRCSSVDPAHPEAGSIWAIEDISDRKAAEEEINKLAFYDALTQLPNRRLLLDRLKRALVNSARSGRFGALLFIDLDEFKTLNDTLGHDQGDLLLQDVAKRLLTCVREGDTVARLGGDEFVVMLEGIGSHKHEGVKHCELIGNKILQHLNRPYQLGGREVRSTPSIGMTLFDGQLDAIDELLKQADLAMYQSKAAGRNTLRFFDAAMQAIVNDRAALEADLREALRLQQFTLFYQPQIVGPDRLTGAEALIRWEHPQRGMVSPAKFIPLAEETGLILALGDWVLETACRQLAAWASRPETAELSVAVNVSARQLHQPDFVERITAVLERTGAQPQRLKLELTESVLVSNIETTIAKMAALKARGVCFSLDDFGTGYSSLSYLKRLPLDQLKIDQGFVRDILIDPNDAAIAKMVIALAASLGLTVVAEGVESRHQRDYLAEQGCHAYQGFFFSRPLPIAPFEAFVADWPGGSRQPGLRADGLQSRNTSRSTPSG